ncbi:MAG: sigma-70 family RNA polymerase sigma factor [Lacipirellulaceae bacterium]
MSEINEPLLPRIARGESAAMELCMDRYGGLVWSLARRYCRGNADAEDLTQEIFLQLWKYAARFDADVAAETTFVAMIARRRLIDHRRRLTTRQEIDSATDREIETDDRSLSGEPRQTDPAQQALLSDEAARARDAMNQLPDQQQQVLDLALNACLTQSEISQKLDMPLGTVKTNARRGLQQLRRLLGEPNAMGGVSS